MDKRIIHNVFYKIADTYPGRIAIEEEGRHISYGDLKLQVNGLANLLISSGVQKGQVVAVLLTPGIALTGSLLAVFSAGAIYLPLDLGFSPKRFREIFTQCLPAMVITDDKLYPELQRIITGLNLSMPSVLIHCGDGSFKIKAADVAGSSFRPVQKNELSFMNPEILIQPDDGNYIVYTSGSTGVGKAILGRHKSLSHFVHWELKEFNIDEDIRVGQLAQVTFDATFRDILVPLCAGGTLCIPDVDTRANPARLIYWMEHTNIHIIHCVPSVFKMLTKELAQEDAGAIRLPELKYVFLAGEILYARDIAAWRTFTDIRTEVINLYGTSESTLAKTFNRIKNIPAGANAVIHAGKPIDNALVAVIKDGVLCAPGEIGDIYIKTPFYTLGYYKDEQLTEKIFVPNPLTNDPADVFHRTGDLGRWLDDGNLEVLGRLDDQVKVNGIRVSLGEIKQALLSEPRIKDVQVLVNSETGASELVCYYIGNVGEQALRTYLGTMLNRNLVPAYLVQMKEFPLNIHGKVDRGSLPKPAEILFADTPYEPVINEREQLLERIWKEVLLQDMIGRNISFFRLGGTSLKAMQVISRIYRAFNIQINLADFFSMSTIARLSSLLSEKDGQDFEEILPVAELATYEVTQMQADLWVMDRLNTSAANVYNMVNASNILGCVDIEAFKRSLSDVIYRHESLRTSFVEENAVPRQQVYAVIDLARYFEYIPLNAQLDMEQVVKEAVHAELVNGFDLQQGPLLRVKLIRTGNEAYVCLLTLHHIIADGWSVELLSRDLQHRYQYYASGVHTELPALDIQYKDYSHWLNSRLKGAHLARLEHYWLEKLEGGIPVTELPLDNHRPEQVTYSSRIYHFKMDEALSAALTSLAARNSVTMFILLNTIVDVLIYKYTGKRELLTGSPFSGRLSKQLENVIGLFVNIVLLKAVINNDDTFSTLLERNKQEVSEAWQHQAYPFNYLPSLLNYEVPKNRFPFVNILVQSQLNSVSKDMLWSSPLDIAAFELEHLATKTDITFNFVEDPTCIHFAIEYKTDLFRHTTIENFGNNICHIAGLIIADEHTPLAGIRLLRTAGEDAEERMFREQMHNL